MNILFLMKFYEIGGIEVVTSTLAKSFINHGHHIVIASFKEPNTMMKERTDQKVVFYTIGDFEYSKKNIERLRKILKKEKIDIVINQWGLPFVPCKVLNKAKRGLSIKTIAAYHNQPDQNARLQDVDIEINSSTSRLKSKILNLKKIVYKIITKTSMRYVYNHSDYYVLLSESHKAIFSNFTGIKNTSKLLVIPNPLTVIQPNGNIPNVSECEKLHHKEKEIIYIGRIDFNQKRVYRVINTWSILEKTFPDWRLTIVGDGVERKNLESQVSEMNLKNVSFEGFQNPVKYYERASILILTSEYEGFGLVLTESMSFGVVPATYGSYSAVYDIIDDNLNGIILPYNKSGYNAEDMAKRLSSVMESPSLYESISIKAKQKSEDFLIEPIYSSWEKLFQK